MGLLTRKLLSAESGCTPGARSPRKLCPYRAEPEITFNDEAVQNSATRLIF